MFKVGSLVRWGAGVLLSLVVVAAGSMAFGNLPYWYGGPINSVTMLGAEKHRDCAVVVRYDFTAISDDYSILIRRDPPEGGDGFTAFLGFAKSNQASPAEYLDTSVPQGIWRYQVFMQGPKGNIESEWSNTVVIDSDLCAPTFSAPRMPINPITSAAVTGKCDVDVSVLFKYWQDSPGYTPVDGVRIYRSSLTEPMNMIADIPLVDFITIDEPSQSEFTSHYIDKDLPAGTYQYMTEFYIPEGATQSNTTDPVTIDDVACKSLVDINIPDSVSIQPVATSTPIPVPVVPQACVWQAAVNVFLRKGPNTALFEVADAVEKGQTYPVVGQSEDGKFWVVEFRPGKQAYITKSETYSLMTGDCSQVPTIQDPLAPLPPPTEQITEDNNPSDSSGGSGASECGDGIDNDGDGQVDGSDRGCIASGGAHE